MTHPMPYHISRTYMRQQQHGVTAKAEAHRRLRDSRPPTTSPTKPGPIPAIRRITNWRPAPGTWLVLSPLDRALFRWWH